MYTPVRRAPCFSEYVGVTILQPEEFLTKVEHRTPELSGAPTFRFTLRFYSCHLPQTRDIS